LEEALHAIEEKIAFPDQGKPKDENQLDGTVKLYYSNGQLKSSIEYALGKRHGLYRFYSRSGRLLEEGYYQKGLPMGSYKQWNRKGYLEKEIFSHPNGSFDLTEWDETGKIIKEVKSGNLFNLDVDVLKESLDGLFKELS
jgi:antitoxin component YwqK of YwqJK toxin-antitoxin module